MCKKVIEGPTPELIRIVGHTCDGQSNFLARATHMDMYLLHRGYALMSLSRQNTPPLAGLSGKKAYCVTEFNRGNCENASKTNDYQFKQKVGLDYSVP